MANNNINTTFPFQYGKATFKPCEKLHLGSEFAYVREHGTKYIGKYMLLIAAPASDGKLRCGIICGRKFSRKAVLRNRAKRLLRESFRLLKARIPPCHVIFIGRQLLISGSLQETQKEMLQLLQDAELWVKE